MFETSEVMSDPGGYFTKEQFDKMLDSCENDKEKLLIKLLWDTGARISEILGLEVNNIKWDEAVLIIKNLKRKKNRTTGKERKGFKRARVSWDGLALLKKYIEKENLSGKVFDFSRFVAFKMVRRIGRRIGMEYVGMKKLHPHHFRHSMSIHLIKNGMPIVKLQELLGHTNLASTGFYLKFSSKEIEEDYHKIMG